MAGFEVRRADLPEGRVPATTVVEALDALGLDLTELLVDGFETGTTASWSTTMPRVCAADGGASR